MPSASALLLTKPRFTSSSYATFTAVIKLLIPPDADHSANPRAITSPTLRERSDALANVVICSVSKSSALLGSAEPNDSICSDSKSSALLGSAEPNDSICSATWSASLTSP